MPTNFIIPPEEQLSRDLRALQLLEAERAAGFSFLPDLKKNISKNSVKTLWKPGTVDDEIARRRVVMSALQERIPQPAAGIILNPVIQQEELSLFEILKRALLGEK